MKLCLAFGLHLAESSASKYIGISVSPDT